MDYGSVLAKLEDDAEMHMHALALDRWQHAERAYARGVERLRRMELATCRRHIQFLKLTTYPNAELIAELEQMAHALTVGGPAAARMQVARERREADLKTARAHADRLAQSMDLAERRYQREQLRRHEASLGLRVAA